MIRRAAPAIALLAAATAVVAASVAAAAAAESAPTGSVAYLAGGPAGSWINIVSAQGGVPRRLGTRLTNANAYPSLEWSPDGRWLAFAGIAPRKTGHGVFTVDRNGKLKRWRSLDKRSASAVKLSWSPAGDAIAYDTESWREIPGDYPECADPEINLRIDITRSDGATRRLSAYPAGGGSGALRNIRWRPDGRQLLYLVTHFTAGHGEECNSGADELFTIDVATGTLRRVRQTSIGNAEWSPDGESIALVEFSTEDNYAHWNLYVMRADGSGRKRLATNILHFAWHPDGRAITVVRNGVVQAVDVRTGRVGLLARRTRTEDPWWLPVFLISSGWVAVERDTQDNSRYETIRTDLWFVALDGGPDHTLTITPRGAERWIGSIAVSPR
jgi:Tol biopolymer transport system component